jgi:hypothetical protein
MTPHTPKPIADFLDEGALARIFAAHERKLEAGPLAPPPEDPAVTRRRWLADRAQALLAGRFGVREVDRVRSDELLATPALEHARAFLAQRERPVLVLLGGTGTGKTTAAAWVAREAGGARPGMLPATTMERRGRYDGDYSAWVDDRTMVALDDLGVEPIDGKGYFAALVDELVDAAYRNRRRLVITTNIDTATMRDRLGDRAASRMVEVAMLAQCGAVDLRRSR